MVSNLLAYGQLVKHRNRKKGDGKPYTITRMKCGKHWQLFQILRELGFRETIQTAFIERINLTIRQGIAPFHRRTWSLAKSQESLLIHIHWWRSFYHFSRPHQSLRAKVPGLNRRQLMFRVAGISSIPYINILICDLTYSMDTLPENQFGFYYSLINLSILFLDQFDKILYYHFVLFIERLPDSR